MMRSAAWLTALLLSVPAVAWATSLTPVASDVSTHYYNGVDYRYQILYTDSFSVQTINLNLFDYLEVTSIDCGGGAAFNPTSLSTCGTSPYNCVAVVCPGASPITVSLSTSGNNQMVQFLYPGGGSSADWPQLTVSVRMHSSTDNMCGVPSMVLLNTGGTNVYGAGALVTSPGNENTACQSGTLPSIVGLNSVPATLSVGRSTSPTSVAWSLQAQLSDGSTAPFNYPLTNPTAFAGALQCSIGGAPYGDCKAAPFTASMQVTATQEYPAALVADPINAANPLPGNANLQFTFAALGAPVVLPITLERSVATLQVAEASNRSEAPAGVPVQFAVTTAQNAAGGEEPRSATFSVVSVSGPVLLADAQSWLSQNGTGAATLSPPADLSADESLSLRATHLNPDATTTTQDMTWRALTLNTNAPVATGTCVLQASPMQVGPGETTHAVLMVNPDGGVPYAAPFTPQWTVTPSDASTQTDPASVAGLLVTAPQNAASLNIVAAFSSALCSNSNVAVDVAVVPDIQVHLSADTTTLAAGSLWHVNAQVSNSGTHPIDGLVFALTPSTGLRSVQRLPMGGATATTHAAAAQAQTLWFTAEVPASGTGPTLSAAFLPQASFACGAVSATLAAYRDIHATVPIATARVQATLRCDAEFDEPTLIGRVFVDVNGDGRPQEDEPGLQNVMVATAAGVYARTDAAGKYHIARLQPGRHAVKLDPASLPVGAYVSTRLDAPSSADGRAEVTLTPGVFRSINFAVRIPDLSGGSDTTFVPQQSGVSLDAQGLTYHAHFSAAPGWTLRGDAPSVRVAQSSDGGWDTFFPVEQDTRHYVLVAEADDGRVELQSFAVYVTGQMIAGYGPRLLGRVLLPHTRAPLQTAEPTLRGVALTAGSQTWSTGKTSICTWDAVLPGAPLECRLRLQPGEQNLHLHLLPAADPLGDIPGPIEVTLPLRVPNALHFFVGLAGGEVSAVLPREAGDAPVDWRAGGAFFYRGVIQGKVLVTAGADVHRDVFLDDAGHARTGSGIASQLFGHDARRVFRDLDPEAYYPVYGDASITVDEREAGGHFFVRVQMDDTYIKWGALNTAIDDAEVGQYVRSLYGLGGRIAAGDATDTWAGRAVFFAAQPHSAAARDELWTTGGSLFFLSHRNVVEGSLRASLEILDTASGLPVRVLPLTEGYDYEADYVGGRLNLDAGLPTRTARGTLTSRGSDGSAARVLVDYEYLPGGDVSQDWSAGARAVGRFGLVSVGVTGVAEISQLGDAVVDSQAQYALAGATARFDAGDVLQARIEVAHSDGTSHAMASSLDGGLTYTLPPVSAPGGTAVALEVSSKVDTYKADLYGRYTQPGFTDSRTAPGTELLQGGLRAEGRVLAATRAWLQADHREQTPGAFAKQQANMGLLGVAQRLQDFELSVEGRYQAASGGTWGDVTGTLAGAQLSYNVNPWLTVLARRRQILHASPSLWTGRGESAIGADLEHSGFRAGGELGLDDHLSLFGRVQGGAPLSPDNDVYIGYLHNVRLGDSVATSGQQTGPQSRLLVGGRQRIPGAGALFAEQHLQVDGSDRLLSRSVGADVQLAPGWSGSVAYERGASHTPFAAARKRDGLSLGTVWVGGPVSLRVGLDGRLETQAGERIVQSGGQTRVEWRPTDIVTLALAGRGASTYGGAEGASLQPRQSAWEGAIGGAWRPRNDFVQAFARYAITYERRADAAATAGFLQQATHVAAASAVLQVFDPLALSPKVAYRLTHVTVNDPLGDVTTADQALLVALRGDWHVTPLWDVGLEGRACDAPGANLSTQYGALAEATMLPMAWLRLGAGYNFSQVSATSVRCVEPGARGLYVRLETLY